MTNTASIGSTIKPPFATSFLRWIDDLLCFYLPDGSKEDLMENSEGIFASFSIPSGSYTHDGVHANHFLTVALYDHPEQVGNYVLGCKFIDVKDANILIEDEPDLHIWFVLDQNMAEQATKEGYIPINALCLDGSKTNDGQSISLTQWVEECLSPVPKATPPKFELWMIRQKPSFKS